jgi:hypothetical protein
VQAWGYMNAAAKFFLRAKHWQIFFFSSAYSLSLTLHS